MSDLPSPLKSPIAAIDQTRAVAGIAATERTVPPFMNQTSFAPVAVLRQKRSNLPSPSKSPDETKFQLVGCAGTDAPAGLAPLFSHIELLPEPSRHRMSERRSPLKSASVTGVHTVLVPGRLTVDVTEPPFMTQYMFA